MPQVDLHRAIRTRYDLCVIGAGAAGLAVAKGARAKGLSVLLAEAGGLAPEPLPFEPEIAQGSPHDPMAMTSRQGLGGTLHIWGRRCLPFERADFGRKAGDGQGWPIAYEDYARWIADAAEFLGVEPVFDYPMSRSAAPDWPEMAGVRLNSAELLGPVRQLADLTAEARGAHGPDLLTGAVATGLIWTDNRVTGAELRIADRAARIKADSVLLACGGLQTTRLLLNEARRHPGRLTGQAKLGRGYMGHLTGSISEITFKAARDVQAFAYTSHDGGSPARRRFLITPPDRPHSAIWLENLPVADPRNRSGEIAFKALVNGAGGSRLRHLANVLGDPLGIVAAVRSASENRFGSGEWQANRLIVRGPGPYRLCYHSEHLPRDDSRVTLSEQTDTLGQPLLRIAFGYCDATIAGIVSAHRALAAALDRTGRARMTMPGSDADLARLVRADARDGYHQIGLTRMAGSPRHGVVDEDCRVHGTENLYVVSASVFPVSSQANPTLSIVAFALRAAAHIGARHRGRKPLRRTETRKEGCAV